MKNHATYFLLLLFLIFLAIGLPFTGITYDNGVQEFRSGYEDAWGLVAIALLFPSIIATILLLIKNHVTAIIGTCFYVFFLVMALLIDYAAHTNVLYDDIGIGPITVVVIAVIGIFLSVKQSVLMIRFRKRKPEGTDILDDSVV